jgi:hypothetical protein
MPARPDEAACHRFAGGAKDEVMASSDSGVGAGDESAVLLGRFVAGDPEAFVVFYRLNLGPVVAFPLRRTGDREVTADLGPVAAALA